MKKKTTQTNTDNSKQIIEVLNVTQKAIKKIGYKNFMNEVTRHIENSENPPKKEKEKILLQLVSKEFGEMETEVPTEDITLPDSTRTAYAAGLDNLFSALQGKVSLFMKAGGNHPLLLEHSAEKYHFVAMLAPRMEDEE